MDGDDVLEIKKNTIVMMAMILFLDDAWGTTFTGVLMDLWDMRILNWKYGIMDGI